MRSLDSLVLLMKPTGLRSVVNSIVGSCGQHVLCDSVAYMLTNKSSDVGVAMLKALARAARKRRSDCYEVSPHKKIRRGSEQFQSVSVPVCSSVMHIDEIHLHIDSSSRGREQ